MEHINKIELLGMVGQVKTRQIADLLMVDFSMVTNRVFRNGAGQAVVESTWHQVQAWECDNIPAEVLDSIRKGDAVHVVGSVRCQSLVSTQGEERKTYSVLAHEVEIIGEE